MNSIKIFDTTLRDGEQSAGTRLGADEKLAIARQLAALNVDIIEAGYPISSPEDFNAVSLISQTMDGPVIAALSRIVIQDIDACVKALDKARKPRIHTGTGVSDAHILGKFRDDRYGKTKKEKQDYLFAMSVKAVRHAKRYIDDVQFYAEDSGRCDIDFLFRIIEGVIAAGATVINIPDTTGYAVPEQFGAMIASIKKNVTNIDKAVISVHCHNDLGMAVANSLTGIKNGAGQVECTINGIGERAGNAALEEIVMALRTRRDYFNADSGINSKELYRSSRMVAEMMGFIVPANKAVIGSNAFAHSSGIHVDGVLKERNTYEIMTPQDIGIDDSNILLTARTGRHGLQHRMEKLGYKLCPEEMEQAYQQFLIEADKTSVVSDAVLHSIAGKIRIAPATGK